MALAALAACSAAPGPVEQERPALRLAVTPSLALSAPLVGLAASPAVTEGSTGLTTTTARTPDDFRALFTSDSVDLATMPTTLAANLANRGVPITMLGVIDSALLKVVGPPGSRGWAALRGQTVRIPFRGDAADLTFQILAAANGLVPGRDVTIDYGTTLPDTISEVATGRVRYAVLPEHFATLTRQRSGLGEVLDLQTEWTRSTGTSTLPQSAVVVRSSFAGEHPALVDRLTAQMRATTDRVAGGGTAADHSELARVTGVPEPVVAAVLPTLRVRFLDPAQVRPDVEAMLTRFLELAPASVGGRLPDPGFLGA